MSEAGEQPEIEIEAQEVAKGPMTLEEALQEVLRSSLIVDGLARGIRESVKALDKRNAHLAVLVESVTEAAYIQLIEGLCAEHKINLIKVADPKKLGEWVGLCKIDREGNPRKVVGCSVAVVRDFGSESPAHAILQEYFANR